MSKYKNKDGIELSYDGHKNDFHINLVKDVVREAITLLGSDRKDVVEFLTENFSIERTKS